MAKQERHGAAHTIKSWRATQHTSPHGDIVATATVDSDHPYTHQASVTRGGAGFSAGLDYTSAIGPSGINTEQFSAGPFRTQRRAQIAASSLLDRAEADKADNYRTGSKTLSYEDL